MSLTGRDLTRNQGTYDTDRKKLLVFNNSFLSGEYVNVSGGLESVALGQIMGKIASTGQWTVCKSGATDGSQVPRAIMLDVLTDIADTGTVDPVNLVNGGKIRVDMLVYNGTDDADTLVGGVRMGDLLIANSKDLELVSVDDDTKFDN
jgi:hypothetical protein